MQERQARVAKTAYLVTLWRALTRLTEPPEVANGDDRAAEFLPRRMRLWLGFPRMTAAAVERLTPGSLGYFNARTRHLDALLSQEIARGIDQLVLLGAGFDSRALRFADALGGCRVFEVDLPATLAEKQARLSQLSPRRSAPVTFVPTDFERQAVSDTLLGAGFDPHKRSLFILEGVTYYLLDSELDALLRDVARCAAPGSALCFDYVSEAFFRGDHSSYGSATLARRWAQMGNLHRSGVADAGDLMQQHGFVLRSELDASELERSYLTPRDGRGRRCWGCFRIAHAERLASD